MISKRIVSTRLDRIHPIRIRSILALALGLVLSLAACGGGGAKTSIQTSNTTMGQELMDLNASYEQGLISAREYNRAKKEILRKYDK
jgi:hypothetical protein